MGKTTLAEFLASAFLSERISVTSDMIPSDVQERLQKRLDMNTEPSSHTVIPAGYRKGALI